MQPAFALVLVDAHRLVDVVDCCLIGAGMRSTATPRVLCSMFRNGCSATVRKTGTSLKQKQHCQSTAITDMAWLLYRWKLGTAVNVLQQF